VNETLDRAVAMLDMSIMASKHVLRNSQAPLQRRLTWLASELERLAAEAYHLADEAGDDTNASPLQPDGHKPA
jgi:hypothetical protein